MKQAMQVKHHILKKDIHHYEDHIQELVASWTLLVSSLGAITFFFKLFENVGGMFYCPGGLPRTDPG